MRLPLKRLFLVSLFIICSFITGSIMGQTSVLPGIAHSFDLYRTHSLQEKLFVHVDKPFYLSGETLWFKIYYVDGAFHKPLELSKVAYLEVIDKDQKPILQAKVSLKEGSGNGSFLIPVSINSGNYIVRAYTNWMKNFSADYYFEKAITIVNTQKKLGLKPIKDSVNYDVQFFPEGGNLVRNIESKVAFKITDKFGKGVNFSGALINQTGDTITKFQPLKFGMGHFLFTPLENNNYKAVIKLNNSEMVVSQLPFIYDQGYTMRLENLDSTQIKVTINSRGNTYPQVQEFVYLFIHTRLASKVSEKITLYEGKGFFVINKNQLGEGISHITIFNESRQPLCERLFFRHPKQKLSIEIAKDNVKYTPRKKVSLDLMASGPKGNPEIADMSVAVYKVDSLQVTDDWDINNYLWLKSDLKGFVESPDYYFKSSENEVDAALDNLMLTQGWRRFKWEDILANDTKPFEFVPEYTGHIIQGKVTDAKSGAPARNINAYLSSPGKLIQFYGSRSNEKGQIKFEMKNFYNDNDIIVVQTNPLLDSTYHIEISSPFSERFSSYKFPLFDLSRSLEGQVLNHSFHNQVQNVYYENYRNRFILPITDSLPFYGLPDQKYLLDAYTRFSVMEDVMREYVSGVQVRKRKGKFHYMVLNSPYEVFFKEDPLILLDGVPIFDTDKIMAFDPLKIKKLDVIMKKYYYGELFFEGIVSYTTYKGDLAGFQLDPHALAIEYDGLQLQREFYSPRYESQKQVESRLPDLRNVLYWSPDLKTDHQGKKHFEFYTSDDEGTYIGIIQGMTKNGLSGSKTFTFEVSRIEQ